MAYIAFSKIMELLWQEILQIVMADYYNLEESVTFFSVTYLFSQDKMDGFVTVHFLGWWLKVGNV